MNTSKIMQIKENGVVIHWKYLLAVALVVFGGGGGWIGISLATTDQVQDKIEIQAGKQKGIDDKQNAKIQANEEGIEEVRHISGQVKFKIDAVQEVQHKQIARDEARRATEKIRSRDRREDEYDRLYDLNMKKLKSGADPCSDLACN
ncbi:MAG: hypothetical protein GWM98_04645 [Nitrospinaceae bacterium]|nr:hypothetical protein [Deltaproteobacteria bacterium]NIY14208.1 hypothetical protein [Nitrospinaceae bacterium]